MRKLFSGRIDSGTLVVWGLLIAGVFTGGCGASEKEPVPLQIPRGYVQRLEIHQEEGVVRFGPFVGYYFAPPDPKDLTRLRFVCFNEKRFYTRDLPANARLFEGEARLAQLPNVGFDIRKAPPPRIRPVFFEKAPNAWTATRPEPVDQYRHFHSCYNARGAVRTGYWLRHEAVDTFVYDMGGRVSASSPLYHRVTPGPDTGFAKVIEFDNGP